jgi:hypothetical protein
MKPLNEVMGATPFTPDDGPLEKGELVYRGNSTAMVYEVIHQEGDSVWTREPLTYKYEGIGPRSNLRRVL